MAQRRLASAAVIAVSIGLAAPVARAGPPLITDDPETLPKGRFEFNTAYTLTLSHRSDASGGRTWEHETPNLDLNFGLAEGVQLKFEVPIVVLDPGEHGDTRAGIGDLSIACKLRLLDEGHAPLSVSIYPALGVPLGSPSRGLGTGSPSLTIPVQIGRHFLDEKLFVYADAGYEEQFAQHEPDGAFVGVAAEYQLREGFILCGEVRHDFAVRHGSDDSLFNLGFKWTLSEHAALIAAAGRSFSPSAQSGSDLLVYLGIQWSF